jgi:hypothetical protein
VSTFLSDRPIGDMRSDMLWMGDSTVRTQLENIVATIVAPLKPGAPRAESITFAIHGRWGMGKSSALQLIRAQAMSAADGDATRLFFVPYSAPIYEASLRSGRPESVDMNVHTTFALGVLQVLAGKTGQEQTRWLIENMQQLFTKHDPQQLGPNFVALRRILQEISVQLSSLVDFDRVVGHLLNVDGDDPGGSRVLVIMIDDLDRCEPTFVWDVLNTIQQWSSVRNLFFVLAIDKEQLHRAVQDRPGVVDTKDFALEKYVQHSIHVPAMDEPRLKRFLDGLGVAHPTLNPVLTLMSNNVDLVRNGLVVQSPRSVKRCVNTLSLQIAQFLAQNSANSTAVRRFLKERLLQYTWPDFYEEYELAAIEHTKKERGRQYHAFVALEETCLQYEADRDEQRLRFELNRLSQQSNVDWKVLPSSLARFLGMKPAFFSAKLDQSANDSFIGKLLQSPMVSASSQNLTQTQDIGTQLDALQQAYYDAESASASEDRAKVLVAAQRAIEIVSTNAASFRVHSRQVASLAGDIAGLAAQYDAYELALGLFDLALTYEADAIVEANNLHRLVAMILENHLVAYYPVAKQCLERLEEPALANVHPEFTAFLQHALQAAAPDGESPGDAPTANARVEELVKSFMENPQDQLRFVVAMGAVQTAKDWDKAREVASIRFRALSDGGERFDALRVAADALGMSDAPEDELEAVDIYRYLLKEAKDWSEDRQRQTPAIQSNLAMLLYRHDFDDEAGRLWYSAYHLTPNDPAIKRAYAQYLARGKRPDLAAAITRGEYIKEEVLQPSQKELPAFFTPPEGRWWIE